MKKIFRRMTPKWPPPFKTSKAHKLATCLIQKNMSTLLQAIMCFLHDEKKFRDSKRSFSKEEYKIR